AQGPGSPARPGPGGRDSRQARLRAAARHRAGGLLRVDRGQGVGADGDHGQPGAGAPAAARFRAAAEAAQPAAARPPAELDPDPDRPGSRDQVRLMRLSPEQLAASRAGSGAHRVVAGAGTGKTAVIADRFRRLVDAGVPASSILVMTFSERAAGEMRNRIRARVPDRDGGGGGLAVGTFHAMALSWLRDDGRRIGLPAGFQILTGAERWIL